MRKIVVGLVALALSFGTYTSPASAKESYSAKKYANCSQLNKVHPGGIAKSAASAKSATLSGYLTPTVSKSVYEASKEFGDYAGTGFSCPKFGKSTLGTIKLKTGWGYITARKVKRPTNGICVFVPLVIEVKNASNMGMGIQITLEDDFENVVGLQVWYGANYNSSEIRNGKFNSSLKVCKARHKWQPGADWGPRQVEAIGPENWYWLNSYSWINNGFQGRADFDFKK